MTQNSISFEEARVAFGIPVGGEVVHWRFMASLLEMDKTPQHGLVVRQGSLVDRSRNEIVRMTLEHPAKFTHLLFLDSDMTFPQDALRRLIARRLPVVGGLYYQRVPPFAPVIFDGQGEGDRQRYINTAVQPGLDGLQKVGACGTGCLLIARAILENLPRPLFAISWDGENQRGEDLHFADLCRKNGVEVFVDTTVVAKHLTSAAVDKSATGWGHQATLLS